MSARKNSCLLEGEGGGREGGKVWLTSPSGCGCDKCPFPAHQLSQLRPGQAEALCTYCGISKEGDQSRKRKSPNGASHTEALIDCIIVGAPRLKH